VHATADTTLRPDRVKHDFIPVFTSQNLSEKIEIQSLNYWRIHPRNVAKIHTGFQAGEARQIDVVMGVYLRNMHLTHPR
jgi:hypothetical protein